MIYSLTRCLRTEPGLGPDRYDATRQVRRVLPKVQGRCQQHEALGGHHPLKDGKALT